MFPVYPGSPDLNSLYQPLLTPAPLPREPSRRVLHISDLHMVERDNAEIVADQLVTDTENIPELQKPHIVIISGDITDRAGTYDAAKLFIKKLQHGLKLATGLIIIVPGNHDYSRDISKQAHDAETGSSDTATIKDSRAVWERFKFFSEFYHSIRGETYHLDPREQGMLYVLEEHKLVILGLNSAHSLDHVNTTRAGINAVAVSRAIGKLRDDWINQNNDIKNWLKIAVWHHPVHGAGDDRITDTQFLDQLSRAGFRLGLHGHVHKIDLFHYPHALAENRKFDILGAGSLSASGRDLRSGYPFQYQMLHVPMPNERQIVRVHTRCREPDRGAFRRDYRWPAGTDVTLARSYHEILV